MTLAVIVVAGVLIGLSLGALGGGGSVLTVPVLVYGLGQSAAQATTGALLLVAAAVMAARQIRSRRGAPGARLERHLDDPIITFSPALTCQCRRAPRVIVTATVVGLLTGFLGVGGGFLVVPALVLALGLPMAYAAGTSLVVITITSASALVVRAGTGAHPAWGLVALLTSVAVAGGWAGARLSARADTSRLHAAFTILLLLVAGYTAWRALPALA